MAVRSGMTNLIARTRRMVDDSDSAVWVDQELQDVLDEHKLRIQREPLSSEKTLTSGTAYEYKRYHSQYRDFEEGGTVYFNVEDSAGSQRGTGDYTADYIRGYVVMTADQVGTALYLTGWSYDLNGAVAQCWRERASKVAPYYDVSINGHSLSRSQWFKHCQETAKMFDSQARARTIRNWRVGAFDDE